MTSSAKNKHPNALLADQALINRAVQGSASAKEQLAGACLPRVRRLVALAYGGHNDAEDVVQVAMITVFRDLPRLRNSDRFIGWLDTVVYNVIRNQGRKRLRLLRMFTAMDILPDTRSHTITPEDEQMGAHLFSRIQCHLMRMPTKKRYGAVLSLFFGYVDSEIATMMGCTVEAAKKRIQYGRRELIAALHADPKCRDLLEKEVRR